MDAYFDQIFQTPVMVTLIIVSILAYLIGKTSRAADVDTPQEKAEIEKASAGLTANQRMKIDAAIDARKKIEAIGLYRAATGLSLRQSKQAVDQRIRERNLTDKA